MVDMRTFNLITSWKNRIAYMITVRKIEDWYKMENLRNTILNLFFDKNEQMSDRLPSQKQTLADTVRSLNLREKERQL